MDKKALLLLIVLGLNVIIWAALIAYTLTLCTGYVCRG